MRLSVDGQAIPLQCLLDRLVMGRGNITEGLHKLAAVHHKGLVKFIQHLSDFAPQRIEQAPASLPADRGTELILGGIWASSKKKVSIWRVVSVGGSGICQL